MKFKSFKSILFTTSLIAGISLFSSNAYAATYTAVNGDSLYKISKIFNTSITSLMNDNGLTNYNINIGQQLNVPGIDHKVQKGESLYLISKKYGIPLASLRRANNIYTDFIDVGQILSVPVKSTNSETTPEATPEVTPESTPEGENNTIDYTASDLDLLARLITAEAQGEEYNAKVAVGAVVLNRVKSDKFANTIKDVIYEKINGYYQFTPVLNGWINKPANEDCIKAAKEALSGIDPTNGALFYFDDSTTNQWLLSRPVSVKIDNMIYTY